MLVLRFPHPTALARQVRDGSILAALHRLEAVGFVRRQHGLYRVTKYGRDELEMTVALTRLVAHTQAITQAAA
jgi:DNA-binding PadR family transcriptional regulator